MTPTTTFFHWNHTPSRDIMHCNNWRQHYAAWMRYVCVWVRGRGYASEWLLVATILAISIRIAVTSNHIKLKAFPTCSHRPNYGVQAHVWKVTHGHYLYLFKWCITTASCCLFTWIQADWPSWLISRLHSGAGVLRGFFGWEAEKVGNLSKGLRCSWHCRPPCKSRVCEWQKWGDTFWMIDPCYRERMEDIHWWMSCHMATDHASSRFVWVHPSLSAQTTAVVELRRRRFWDNATKSSKDRSSQGS